MNRRRRFKKPAVDMPRRGPALLRSGLLLTKLVGEAGPREEMA